jgi:subtilisin family serine protease
MARPIHALACAVLAAAFGAGCADRVTSVPESPTEPDLSTAAATDRYVLLAQSETSLPAGLEESVRRAGGTVARAHPSVGIALVRSTDPGFAARARRIAGVRSVTPDVPRRFVEPPRVQTLPMSVAPQSIGDDEPFFPLQWSHDAIHTEAAWDAGARGTGVRVAVLDGGFDADHPDLAPNLDLEFSRSFVDGFDFDEDVGTFWHGTHVAGIVAAADNEFGVIGVAPEATLIGVKVLHGGSGSFGDVFDAIIYASTPIVGGGAGAQVINMSLGALFVATTPEDLEFIAATTRVLNYAYHNGVTVIVSAGNAATDLSPPEVVAIFSSIPRALGVSALGPIGWALDMSTNLDRVASYTNYGLPEVDFSGPGGDFALPGEEPCTVIGLTRPCWVFDMVFSTNLNGWAWAAGTSMAAPAVTGVAALIIEDAGGSLHPQAVHAALRASADDLGAPGIDPFYGEGRVNAARAVGAAASAAVARHGN